MRVIEQLVQHFWSRRAISRDEALYLVQHGFIRDGELPGLTDSDDAVPDLIHTASDDDDEAIQAEKLEDELTGRNAGSRKGGGKRKKPKGHNLAPALTLLGEHFAMREPYPALLELGNRFKRCTEWADAAVAISASKPAKLESALIWLLNSRPRSFGELWYWFDLEPLFQWSEQPDNTGPVAESLAKLLRTSNRNQVGRAGQLMKASEFRSLVALLDARRKFLDLLPVLYDKHHTSLGRWMVPPAGDAAHGWPALPWAFVIVYNAREGVEHAPPPGYQVNAHLLPFEILRQALATALPIEPTRVRDLLIHRLREQSVPTVGHEDWWGNAVFDRPLTCPLHWRI